MRVEGEHTILETYRRLLQRREEGRAEGERVECVQALETCVEALEWIAEFASKMPRAGYEGGHTGFVHIERRARAALMGALPIEILAAGGPKALRLAHACPSCNGCVNLDEMRCEKCGVALREWLRKGKR